MRLQVILSNLIASKVLGVAATFARHHAPLARQLVLSLHNTGLFEATREAQTAAALLCRLRCRAIDLLR